MDWNLAIDINREALKRIVAALVAMAGFADALTSPFWGDRHETSRELPERPNTATRLSDDCQPPRKREADIVRPTLPRHLHRAVLRVLRPAEAAARRLIIVAARGIDVAPLPPRRRNTKAYPSLFVRNGAGTGIVLPPGMAGTRRPGADHAKVARPLGLPLLDPARLPFRHRRQVRCGVPRIWAPGCSAPAAIPVHQRPRPDDPLDATRLGMRLAALGHVLDDLPGAARRFARWRAQATAASGVDQKPGRRRWPMKPGLPPGARRPSSRRKVHEVDDILGATHGLAFWTLAHPDTS